VAKNSLIGEILHTVAVRLRVTGSGNLQLFLRSMDDIRNTQLVSQVMTATTNIEPTILANFEDQRTQLELKTTEINEVFIVSRIVVFVKATRSGYPI
jgi:hypothetical protein